MYKKITSFFCTPYGCINKFLLAMKLTTVLLVVTLLQVSAAGFAQKVNYVKKDATLKQVFNQIYKQTSYSILWTAQNIKVNRTIDANFHNAPLEEVLSACFEGQHLTYTIADKTIVIKEQHDDNSSVSPAPVVQITGTVVDEKNMSMPGVSVKVKGTTTGLVTDANGHFKLTVPDHNAILVFSFIGYKVKEMPVGGNNDITVVMEPLPQGLTEAVVTALGIKKSSEMISYATQTVKGTELQTAPETNVAANLVGKVAGLDIHTKSTMFESPDIYLRGSAALVVIDGVPTDKNTFNFWSIDANNIESVTVLKGTSAAALYGADGINGAIMITTKTGKDGSNGTEVTVNTSNQFQGGFLKLPKTQTQYGMGWNGYYAFIDGNGGDGWEDNYGYVWGPKLNQGLLVPQYNSTYNPNQLYTFTEAGYNGTSHYEPLPLITRGTHNLQNFLNNEYITTDNISFSSKTDNSDFHASLTNVYQKGQVPNTQLNATTFNLAGSVKVSDKLKVQAILSYNYQNSPNYPANATSASGGSGAGPGDYFYDILLWMGPDVDIRDMRNYWQPSGPNPRPGTAPYGTKNLQQFTYNYSWYNNPYFVAYENLNGYTNSVINAQVNANYSFTKDLNLMVRSAVSANNSQSSDQQPYSFIDNNFKTQLQGGYFLDQANNFQIISDALLTYKKNFLKNFHATITAGATTRYQKETALAEGTVGGLTEPGFYNLSASAGGPSTSSNSLAERQSSGILGYADVDYKSMIYLGITGRNDWVSDLPRPHNSFFYPSANIGFVVSRMVKLPDVISYLKIRGAWAQVSDNNINISGSNNIYQDWYASLVTFQNGPRWNGTPSLSLPGTLIPPTLKPNTTISREVGTEISFFKNKLGFDFTYFNYNQKDFLVQAPISAASGYDYIYLNGGNTTRKGLEAMVKAVPVKTRNFAWDIAANWDKVHTYQGSYYGGATIENEIPVGGRTDAVFARAWETDGHGNIVYDANGNPVATPYNVHLGNADPNWEFGLSNTFTYKRFSLKISVDGRVGGIIYDGVQAQLYDAGNDPKEVNPYRDDAYLGKATYSPGGVVVKSGNVTYSPISGNIVSDTRTYEPNTTKVNYIDWVRNFYRGGNGAYSAEIYNRTFVKLREVLLTYNFDSKLLQRVHIKAASASLTGRNLFLWTKVPDLDPDGYNGYALPEPGYRNIGFNLNLKF